MYSVESISAGHMWSNYMYTQWYIRKPNGQTVDNRNGEVKRWDSEADAQAACDKLNKKGRTNA